MLTQSVCNAVDMNVHAYAKIPELKLVSRLVKAITRSSENKFHAICKARNAILGLTPGSEHKSSTVFGTSESKSSRSF